MALPIELSNPGAEKVKADNANRPADAGVYTSAGVDASFLRDVNVKRSGEASFHIVNRGRPDAPKGASQSALYIMTGNVAPGLTYSVTGWIKTKDVLTGDAGFHIRLKSAKGWLDSSPRVDLVKGTNNWTKITADFTTPSGATQFSLFLIVRYKGEAWFDDIEMRDNLKTWSEKRFSQLHKELTRLQTHGRSVTPAPSAKVMGRLTAGIAKAQELLVQSRQLSDESRLTIASRRRFCDQATKLDALVLQFARIELLSRSAEEANAVGQRDWPFVVGFAPSTMHVFLEDIALNMEIVNEKKLLAVRGETESTQLVIFAHKNDLKNVRVAATDLTGEQGVIPSQAVVIKPVGFVRTQILSGANPYPREYDYAGWWPDPLLDNFAFDVKKGETQPVWIEVHVPRDLPAGDYRGTIQIAADGQTARIVGFAVEVANVVLPKKWRFKNLLSWHEDWAQKFYKDRWTDELHEKYFQFLLDRRINVISMYGNEQYATTENLIRFAKRGQNVLMLASIHPQARIKHSNGSSLRQRLDAMIPAMKQAGLLDRCIVYGWDERGPDWHDEIRYGAQLLIDDYNSMPLLMAGTDASPGTFGTDSSLSGLPNIIYCPIMPHFNQELAARARANGNHVWWYEVWWIIEDPLLRSRLIPWQSFKVGAEGYLVWCLNRFVGNDKPIFDPDHPNTRTTWNPDLDGGYENSTAMYIYPGKDGPISSLRLENFSDGIEDYELLMLGRDILVDLENQNNVNAKIIRNLRNA